MGSRIIARERVKQQQRLQSRPFPTATGHIACCAVCMSYEYQTANTDMTAQGRTSARRSGRTQLNAEVGMFFFFSVSCRQALYVNQNISQAFAASAFFG